MTVTDGLVDISPKWSQDLTNDETIYIPYLGCNMM